jgi:hypothetical protein
MATKTWTDNISYSETNGNFDGLHWTPDDTRLNLRKGWESRTWLGEVDETEEWVGDETVEVKRAWWQADFDSGIGPTNGWGYLSWQDVGTGVVKARIKSENSQGALTAATYYPTGGTGFYESQPQDVECPDGRWCRLQMWLESASTPILNWWELNYGEGC